MPLDLENLFAGAEQIREVLREVEWSSSAMHSNTYGGYCPVCHGNKPNHSLRCRLDAAVETVERIDVERLRAEGAAAVGYLRAMRDRVKRCPECGSSDTCDEGCAFAALVG